MDLEEGLLSGVGPFRELFSESNDVLHPLKFSSGMEMNIAAPLNNAFGLLLRFSIPDTTHQDTRATKIMSSGRVLGGRSLGVGSYLVSKGVAGPSGRAPRTLVTAMTAENGPSEFIAEYRGDRLLVRGVGLLTRASQIEGGASVEYRGEDYTVSGKVHSDRSLYGSYHQRVAPSGPLSRVTLGGEAMLSDLSGKQSLFPDGNLGPQRAPALSYAIGGSVALPDGDSAIIAAVKQIRMGKPFAEAIYRHNITDYVTAFTAVEYRHSDGFSKTLTGFRTRFPRTRSVFTGSLTSGGEIRGEYERRLLSNVKGAVHIDGVLWPPAGKAPRIDVGVKLTVGPHPAPHLDLTPVLMRDGPRAWQK